MTSPPAPSDALDALDAPDAGAFRRAMAGFPTGVTVIAADDGAQVHAMTASSFTSVSLDPPLVLVCVALSSRLTPVIRRAEAFAVHVLGAEQTAAATLCAGGDPTERAALLTRAPSASPRLGAWLARFDCALHAEQPGGDHAIFLGRVRALAGPEGVDPDAGPLLWWRSRLAPMPGG